MRAMVATVALSALLAAGFATTLVTSATAQDAPTPTPDPSVSNEDLVDRLVGLERRLPTLPPSNVVISEDETFGQLEGDFLGALTELELISDDARQLFVDADEADGAVADAVSLVSRGYLRLEEAYTYLSRYEAYDLARPMGATDDGDVSIGADRAVALAQTGLDLLDLARMDALVGYGVLRDSDAADDAEKGLLDASYRATQQYLTTMRPETHTLVSASTTAVLVALDRYEGAAPSEARAKDVDYVCVPRELYPADSPDPMAALTSMVAADELELVPTADCPDLGADENTVDTVTR